MYTVMYRFNYLCSQAVAVLLAVWRVLLGLVEGFHRAGSAISTVLNSISGETRSKLQVSGQVNSSVITVTTDSKSDLIFHTSQEPKSRVVSGMENGRAKVKKSRNRKGSPPPVLLSNGINNYNGAPNKLVLHFDVRNTVLVADSVTRINVEQALNTYLTGVTWGKDTAEGWKWASDNPSLGAPGPGYITYYKHLEKQLVRRPEDRAVLRAATGDFTQETIGKRFYSYFKNHLDKLEWQSPIIDDQLVMRGSGESQYHYILPSFFRLLYQLHAEDRDFSVIIRTYGMDAPNVLASINRTLQGHHPDFPHPLPIPINLKPGLVHRNSEGITFELPGGQKCSSERDIQTMLNSVNGVCAFVDDFIWWQNHDYRHTTGKPMWLDPSSPHFHHIFFDDNLRITDVDSIVDLRLLEDKQGRSLSGEECVGFEDTLLVQADLLQSISDQDYLIDKVRLCENNYRKWLLKQHR